MSLFLPKLLLAALSANIRLEFRAAALWFHVNSPICSFVTLFVCYVCSSYCMVFVFYAVSNLVDESLNENLERTNVLSFILEFSQRNLIVI